MNECVCPAAGFCELAKRTMSPHLRQLCQTREDYRRLFHGLPQQEKPKPEPKPPCRFRGADTRTVECIKCGPNRGKLVQLFVCDLKGLEVSAERWTTAQAKDEVCRSCGHYSLPPLAPAQSAISRMIQPPTNTITAQTAAPAFSTGDASPIRGPEAPGVS